MVERGGLDCVLAKRQLARTRDRLASPPEDTGAELAPARKRRLRLFHFRAGALLHQLHRVRGQL